MVKEAFQSSTTARTTIASSVEGPWHAAKETILTFFGRTQNSRKRGQMCTEKPRGKHTES